MINLFFFFEDNRLLVLPVYIITVYDKFYKSWRDFFKTSNFKPYNQYIKQNKGFAW